MRISWLVVVLNHHHRLPREQVLPGRTQTRRWLYACCKDALGCFSFCQMTNAIGQGCVVVVVKAVNHQMNSLVTKGNTPNPTV
jgi:hypothetical protein